MSNIIDVINTEEDIGHIITDKCNIKHIAILSGVSKLFNRIVKNDMEKQRNKYIKRQILRKIDVIITNKMYSMIKIKVVEVFTRPSKNMMRICENSRQKYIPTYMMIL